MLVGERCELLELGVGTSYAAKSGEVGDVGESALV